MKIANNIYNEIISLKNLFLAWDEFKKDKKNKKNRYSRPKTTEMKNLLRN